MNPKRLRAIIITLFALSLPFFSKSAFAILVDQSTFSADASALSSIKQIRVVSDGTVYVLGTDTAKFVKVSADGTSSSNINYDLALPTHSGADFVIIGNAFYIAINGTPRLARYDVSGTSATQVYIITPATGGTSISLGIDGTLYNTRSSTLKGYDTSLSETSSASLASPPSRSTINSAGVFYYLSTAGNLRKSTDYTSTTDVVVASSIATSPLGIFASSDGTAYTANTSAIKKVSPAGSTLWSKNVTNLAAMTVDSAGKVYWVNTSGVITILAPIVVPSVFTAEASGATIDLEWTTGVVDADFSGVTIRRSTSGYPTSPTDGTAVTSDSVATTYADSGLADSTTYYYTIFNETADGYYSAGVNATATTTDVTPPAAPSLSASKPTIGANSINLSWNAPATTDTFRLTRIIDGGSETFINNAIPNATTTYSDTGLSDGSYVYKIYARDSVGNLSSAGTSSTLTIDTTAPAAPSIDASKLTPNASTINLSWNAPSGTNSFRLTRNRNGAGEVTVNGAIASATISYDDTGLTDATYVYKIYSIDSFGNESNAGTSSTITIDTTAPSTPTFFGGAVSGTTINLSWNNPSSDFASVTIRRSTSSAPLTVSAGNPVVQGSSGTTYADTGLSDGSYYYSIFALDSFGNVSVRESILMLLDTTAPNAPSLSGSLSGSTINLSWNAPFTTNTFMLRRGTTSSPTSSSGTAILASTPVSTISYADTGLADGTYYYSVFAIDDAGNISTAGSLVSSITIDTTAPSTPTSFGGAVSGTSVNLSWTNPVSDFASVTIRKSTSSAPLTVSAGDPVVQGYTGTTHTDTGLADGSYYYSIFALDSFGNVSVRESILMLLDTTRPSGVSDLTATVSGTTIILTWANPIDSDFSSITIRRSTVDYPADIESDTLVVEDLIETEYEDTGLADETYYYSLFAKDSDGNASEPATILITLDTSPEVVDEGPDDTEPTVLPLTLTVTPPTENVSIGGTATFILAVNNPGEDDASEAVIEFTLPNNLEFLSAEILEEESALIVNGPLLSTNLACVVVGNTVTCPLGTISASSTVSIHVNTSVVNSGALTLEATLTTDSEEVEGTTPPEESGGGGMAIDNRTLAGSNAVGCSLLPQRTL